MVELKRKDKIEEMKSKFVHTVKMTYPKENVKSMLESWSKTVEESDYWLNGYDELLKTQIDKGIKDMAKSLEDVGKSLEEFNKLSEEDQVKKLREEYAKQIENHKKAKEQFEQGKKDYIAAVEQQMAQIKGEVTRKRQDKINATKLWTNVVRRF